jgi:hypothetical protein
MSFKNQVLYNMHSHRKRPRSVSHRIGLIGKNETNVAAQDRNIGHLTSYVHNSGSKTTDHKAYTIRHLFTEINYNH